MDAARKIESAIIRGGLISFIFSAFSAAVTITGILSQQAIARKNLDLEGGPAFSAYVGPAMISLTGLAMSLFSLGAIFVSLYLNGKRPPQTFTFCHLAALIMLTPAVYQTAVVLIRITQT